MFLPRLAHVVGSHHDAERFPIVPAVEHQNTGFNLHHLRFRRVVEGGCADLPSLSVILRVDDGGVGKAFLFGWVLVLGGKDDRAVSHGDPFARSL